VRIRHDQTELAATAFRKDGGVTRQYIEDNKYLASTLRQIQAAQLARDENKLPTLTLRERRRLKTSLEYQSSPRLVPPRLSRYGPLRREGRR
jgi:hypothetical protein